MRARPVHYKANDTRQVLVKWQMKVGQRLFQLMKYKLNKETDRLKAFADHVDQLMCMMFQLKTSWNGRLGRVGNTKQWVTQASNTVQITASIPKRRTLKEREPWKAVRGKLLFLKVTKPAKKPHGLQTIPLHQGKMNCSGSLLATKNGCNNPFVALARYSDWLKIRVPGRCFDIFRSTRH